MAINRNELLTNNLKICENCEWCCYHGEYNVLPRCLLDNSEKGLFEYCDKFKTSTGHHFTFGC